MERFKGTPGPWRKDYEKTNGHIKSICKRRELHERYMTPTVARYDRMSVAQSLTDEEIEANGDAIAAIPDVLDAMASAIKALGELNPHYIPTSYETPTEKHQRECVNDAYDTLLAAYNLAIKGPS